MPSGKVIAKSWKVVLPAGKILNEVASKNNILKKQIEDFRKNLQKKKPNK